MTRWAPYLIFWVMLHHVDVRGFFVAAVALGIFFLTGNFEMTATILFAGTIAMILWGYAHAILILHSHHRLRLTLVLEYTLGAVCFLAGTWFVIWIATFILLQITLLAAEKMVYAWGMMQFLILWGVARFLPHPEGP